MMSPLSHQILVPVVFVVVVEEEGAGADAKTLLKVDEGQEFYLFFLSFYGTLSIGGPGSGKVSHSQQLSQESQGRRILHLNVIELLKSTFGLTSKFQ